MEESIVKVTVPANVRIFEDYDTDLRGPTAITHKRETILSPRQVRSTGLRAGFLQGLVRVTEGKIEFTFKDSAVIIEGVPGGNKYLTLIGPDGKEIKKYFEPEKVDFKAHVEAAKPVEIPVEKPIIALDPDYSLTSKTEKPSKRKK